MVGRGSETLNMLINFNSNISIKKSDVKRQYVAKAQADSSTINIVAPEITTNSNEQDEADRQNSARIAAIGVKEAILAAITSIIGSQITNPIHMLCGGSDS